MRRPSDRRILWSAILLAAVSIGVTAGPLPWRLAGDSGLAPGVAPLAPLDKGGGVSLQPILDLSLFGAVASTARRDPEAPVSDLGLILRGVVIASPATESSAIISGTDQPARAFQVGETITGASAGMITLGVVFTDHVVLAVNGHDETLWFPRGETEMGADSAAPARAGSGVAALRALVTGGSEEVASETDDAANPPSRAEPSTPEEIDVETTINTYRDQIRDNPATVLSGLGLEASEDGYRVGQGASPAVLTAGLQPGDIVSRVNGQQVGNIEEDRGFFDEVVASGRARIEVVRNGQSLVFSFPLR